MTSDENKIVTRVAELDEHTRLQLDDGRVLILLTDARALLITLNDEDANITPTTLDESIEEATKLREELMRSEDA